METQQKYKTVEVLKSNLTGKLYETEKDLIKGDHEYISKEIESEFFYDENLEEMTISIHNTIRLINKYGSDKFTEILKEY